MQNTQGGEFTTKHKFLFEDIKLPQITSRQFLMFNTGHIKEGYESLYDIILGCHFQQCVDLYMLFLTRQFKWKDIWIEMTPKESQGV